MKASYLGSETIAAVATGSGGALSLIRISGSDAFPIYGKLIDRPFEFKSHKRVQRVWLLDSQQKRIDDAVATLFQNPASFTGEDTVELTVHGSPLVVEKVLSRLCELGARLALAGEFSFRAVKNGKITLVEAEAIADLIGAEDDQKHRLAIDILEGRAQNSVSEISQSIRKLTAFSELGIDFSDQDVEEVSLPNLKRGVTKVAESVQRLVDSFDRGKRISDGIRLAIVGSPNAGKSSLFNHLLGEDRSIVSNIAGTTRDIVREKFVLQGSTGTLIFRMEDTAGLRHSEDLIEQEGVLRARKAAQAADIVLWLVDPYDSSLESCSNLFGGLNVSSEKVLGVWTKQDLGLNTEAEGLKKLIVGSTKVQAWCSLSALDQMGLRELISALIQRGESLVYRSSGEWVLTKERHYRALVSASESLVRALESSSEELLAADLRRCLLDLESLIGETVTDDLLGIIFSEFCIGK
jgi:tRNA modification GTPase